MDKATRDALYKAYEATEKEVEQSERAMDQYKEELHKIMEDPDGCRNSYLFAVCQGFSEVFTKYDKAKAVRASLAEYLGISAPEKEVE